MLVDLVQVVTRDGVRLDGIYRAADRARVTQLPCDVFCLVHGTGGNFYSSTLFDAIEERLLSLGLGVLRVNTRGHDGISNASTSRGGLRLGAAYEVVDDCRHDLAAWLDWMSERAGPRVGLIGHSLGAVKAIYAAAQDATFPAACIIAVSPPRLSYSWFCSSPECEEFLANYAKADQLVTAGQPTALLEVTLPLPFVITAAGYIEKYGPDERYNYLNLLPSVRCPTFVTLGVIEVANNMAFRNSPAELAKICQRRTNISQTLIPDADHFYSKAREPLLAALHHFLGGTP